MGRFARSDVPAGCGYGISRVVDAFDVRIGLVDAGIDRFERAAPVKASARSCQLTLDMTASTRGVLRRQQNLIGGAEALTQQADLRVAADTEAPRSVCIGPVCDRLDVARLLSRVYKVSDAAATPMAAVVETDDAVTAQNCLGHQRAASHDA